MWSGQTLNLKMFTLCWCFCHFELWPISNFCKMLALQHCRSSCCDFQATFWPWKTPRLLSPAPFWSVGSFPDHFEFTGGSTWMRTCTWTPDRGSKTRKSMKTDFDKNHKNNGHFKQFKNLPSHVEAMSIIPDLWQFEGSRPCVEVAIVALAHYRSETCCCQNPPG